MSSKTVPEVRRRKRAAGAEPLVMVTAYDEPSARLCDAAGVDLLLVGDSVANTVLGYPDTLHVTIDDMARHTAAVARAEPSALVVGDLPWLSYHTGVADAVRNAATLVRAGAGCVKLEGGAVRTPVVRGIIDAEIPVMGHLGLTPQSVHAMGGYRVQGKDLEDAKRLLEDAHALEDAGCFALVCGVRPRCPGRPSSRSSISTARPAREDTTGSRLGVVQLPAEAPPVLRPCEPRAEPVGAGGHEQSAATFGEPIRDEIDRLRVVQLEPHRHRGRRFERMIEVVVERDEAAGADTELDPVERRALARTGEREGRLHPRVRKDLDGPCDRILRGAAACAVEHEHRRSADHTAMWCVSSNRATTCSSKTSLCSPIIASTSCTS